MSSTRPFKLNPTLLDTTERREVPGSLGATTKAHGLYAAFEFVLRLSPQVHEKLEALPTGIVSSGEVGFDGAQAFSTYLHETIHWWQHVGSTFGLISSLTYPAEAHANHNHLITLGRTVGFKKSIRQLAMSMDGPVTPDTQAGLANIIVNNQFDFDAFRYVTYGPDARQHIVGLGQFQSIGHALAVTYGSVVFQLGQVADPEFKVIPKPDDWYRTVMDQADAEVDGYYYGSPVDVMPIGAREIMEGQARFSQIQYLYFASGGHLDWDDFEDIGWLGTNVYTAAFDGFLTLARLERPATADDSVVALFLLICDMALNPGSGFPFPAVSPSTFIEDVDPGTRFLFLASAVRKHPKLAQTIRAYSREEYVEVSQRLAESIIVHPPMKIARTVADWPKNSASVAALMDELQTFDFEPMNLPIRFMLAHFIAFMRDKAEHPEVFCWPGAWMAGERVSDHVSTLFDRHRAAFVDKADDDGVFPRTYPDKDEATVHETFQNFYASTVTYDLTRQWIVESGPFHYRYNWLVQNATHEEMKEYGDRHFHMIYGVWPDDIEILAGAGGQK
ncbi:hypothetical protein [uncultured Brevundimonas sp.]|uniref:hypothetical protein n=1 Tax=uncultured Brevundimonas sp. TaxID=213418 RepID=UPI0025DBD3A0|nr:hypothetical protein [uncultured Brevundimonas sp.]